MNQRLTPLDELNDRLMQLAQGMQISSRTRRSQHLHDKNRSHSSASPWLNAYDDLLESLRLEASLFKSEDSPFTQRRKAREEERARRLAEARILAEAQFERMARERALAEAQLERMMREQELAERQARTAQERAAQEAAAQVALNQDLPDGTRQHLDDWDASIEYTREISSEIASITHELTIQPDDSIFLEANVTPIDGEEKAGGTPEIAKLLDEVKRSLPPQRVQPQVTTPPASAQLSLKVDSQPLLRQSLLGLLPPKPRHPQANRTFYGAGFASTIITKEELGERVLEIDWNQVDTALIDSQIGEYRSISLAPRAFTPASPMPRRSITLRLKSSAEALEELRASGEKSVDYDGAIPLEEDFNLSDFDEHRDPELHNMHETYRALEEQVGQFPSSDHVIDNRQAESVPVDLLSFEPGFTPPPEEARANLSFPDEAAISVADPFEELEDLSFDPDQLTSGFDWGDTPTNIFGDEATPTNIFSDEEPKESDDVFSEETPKKKEKNLLSRFFSRK